ncbi:MAG: mechanosensitive ion channel domain-containing protein [Xenococcaceae cyanobacterium]
MTKSTSRRCQRLWALVLLGILTLLLTLNPIPSTAQTSGANPMERADVVVDGKVLFKVGDFGRFTAAERAEIINEALEQEVRSPKPVKIEVVQVNQQTIIRNRTTERHLLAVTRADVISASSTVNQALVWRELLQAALRQGQLERTPTYFRQGWLFSIGVVLGAIAFHLSLRFLGKLGSRQLTRLLSNPASQLYPWEQSARLFWQLALLGLQVGLWIAVCFYITDIFPDIRSWRYKLFDLLTSQIFSLGNSNYSALGLLLLLAFTIGLWFAVRGLTLLFKFYILSRTGADTGLQEVVAILAQYILTFLGLIVLWQIWGLDVGALAIIASVFGVGIGFGLQNIANNFISGLIITLERPIQVGDFINVGNLVGNVRRIGARSTEIQTLDQVSIIVPNSRFLESEVINWTHSDPVSRLQIPVGVAYGSDVKKVKAALLEAAKSHPDVLITPRPQVWFQKFGDSSLDFNLLVWTGEPKKQFKLKSDLNYRIEMSLRRYGVEVPFPQRDLHLRSPQLDQLISALLIKQGLTLPDKESQQGDGLEPSLTMPSEEELSDEFLEPLEDRLSDSEIEELVTVMRGEGGLEIKDRRYRLNVYPACFVGSEAVDWLVQKKTCTREEAIELGQILIERGIIHHVVDQHHFKDAYLFYRFYADETAV